MYLLEYGSTIDLVTINPVAKRVMRDEKPTKLHSHTRHYVALTASHIAEKFLGFKEAIRWRLIYDSCSFFNAVTD